MRWVKIVLAIAFVIYPFLIYFGLSHIGLHGIAAFFIAIALARFLVFHKGPKNSPLVYGLLASLGLVIIVSAIALLSHSPEPFRYYPVSMNLAMFILFTITLLKPPSMIQRFAELYQGELPPQGIQYTRNVTKVWCAFFVLNGSIALYTAVFTDLAIWTLYNGMIAYLLMGALFLGEMMVRRYVLKDSDSPVG